MTKSNVLVVILAQGSMQFFWAFVRSSQIMLFTTYVCFNYPPVLQTFMAYSFYIAEMDVMNTETLYSYLTFEAADTAFDDNFALFGVDTMQFLVNTGPIIPVLVALILHKVLFIGLKFLALRYYKLKIFRSIGMYASKVNLTHEIVKLVIESYLYLFFAMTMTLVSLLRTTNPTW